MGLFGTIGRALKSSKVISIGVSLGNVLIAGNSEQGKNEITRDYVIDSANSGIGVLVLRDYECGFDSFPTITHDRSVIYEIDCAGARTTNAIDVFSGMCDIDVNSFIIRLFDIYNEIDKGKRMNFQKYIGLLRSLAAKSGRKVRLDTLADYPIEELDNCNMTYCSGTEQGANDRFLNSMRAVVGELESYFSDFASNQAGRVLSGGKSLEMIFRSSRVVEVSLDFSHKFEESALIVNAVVDAASRFDPLSSKVSGVNIICDGIPNDIMIQSPLPWVAKRGRGSNILCVTQDVNDLSEQSDAFVESMDSIFFMRQISNRNKELCSSFFGEKENELKSITKPMPSFADILCGNLGRASKTVTYSKEKKRIYPPEDFATLGEDETIYYFKKTNEHGRLSLRAN